MEGTEEQDVDIFMEKMIKARDDLKSKAGAANIVKAQAKQKEYYDHRHSPEVSNNFFSTSQASTTELRRAGYESQLRTKVSTLTRYLYACMYNYIRNEKSSFLSMSHGSKHTIKNVVLNITAEVVFQYGKPETSMLVFVPNMAEINFLHLIMEEFLEKHDPTISVWFFVLHSQIPFDEQADAFKPPHRNTINIILATNITESSVTIPRLYLVIDTVIRQVLQVNPEENVNVNEGVVLSSVLYTAVWTSRCGCWYLQSWGCDCWYVQSRV